jgi:hypothetical protein
MRLRILFWLESDSAVRGQMLSIVAISSEHGRALEEVKLPFGNISEIPASKRAIKLKGGIYM